MASRQPLGTCDADSIAAALVAWAMPGTEIEVRFCGHHANKHAAELKNQGFMVLRDEREPVDH